MSFVRKILAQGRIRTARANLSKNPSPRNYVALAQEYVRLGLARETLAICDEGLRQFAGNTLLSNLAERARRMAREHRMAELRRSLAEAPSADMFDEMCELLVELARLMRAEDTAREWIAWQDSPRARLMLARVRVERFLADRARDLGLAAMEALEDAVRLMPEDDAPLRLELQFLTRIGAWEAARKTATKLLQIVPGDPEVEGRFRTLESMDKGDSPTPERALLDVERTGKLAVEEKAPEEHKGSSKMVRPVLRELAAAPDVHAALYVRGATVLIQGPKGATAERTARSIRSILTSGRSTARRLGMGRLFQIQLEGDFGQLAVAPGETDAGALWTNGPIDGEREEALLGLAGLNADLEEAGS